MNLVNIDLDKTFKIEGNKLLNLRFYDKCSFLKDPNSDKNEINNSWYYQHSESEIKNNAYRNEMYYFNDTTLLNFADNTYNGIGFYSFNAGSKDEIKYNAIISRYYTKKSDDEYELTSSLSQLSNYRILVSELSNIISKDEKNKFSLSKNIYSYDKDEDGNIENDKFFKEKITKYKHLININTSKSFIRKDINIFFSDFFRRYNNESTNVLTQYTDNDTTKDVIGKYVILSSPSIFINIPGLNVNFQFNTNFSTNNNGRLEYSENKNSVSDINRHYNFNNDYNENNANRSLSVNRIDTVQFYLERINVLSGKKLPETQYRPERYTDTFQIRFSWQGYSQDITDSDLSSTNFYMNIPENFPLAIEGSFYLKIEYNNDGYYYTDQIDVIYFKILGLEKLSLYNYQVSDFQYNSVPVFDNGNALVDINNKSINNEANIPIKSFTLTNEYAGIGYNSITYDRKKHVYARTIQATNNYSDKLKTNYSDLKTGENNTHYGIINPFYLNLKSNSYYDSLYQQYIETDIKDSYRNKSTTGTNIDSIELFSLTLAQGINSTYDDYGTTKYTKIIKPVSYNNDLQNELNLKNWITLNPAYDKLWSESSPVGLYHYEYFGLENNEYYDDTSDLEGVSPTNRIINKYLNSDIELYVSKNTDDILILGLDTNSVIISTNNIKKDYSGLQFVDNINSLTRKYISGFSFFDDVLRIETDLSNISALTPSKLYSITKSDDVKNKLENIFGEYAKTDEKNYIKMYTVLP